MTAKQKFLNVSWTRWLMDRADQSSILSLDLMGLFIYAIIFILGDVCAWGLFNFCSNNDDDVFTDPEGLYLSQFLLDGGSLGVPLHLYRMHIEGDDTSSLAPSHPPQSHSPSHSHSPLDTQRPPQEQRISPMEGSVRHADSNSLSEDEVFYNWNFDDDSGTKKEKVFRLFFVFDEKRMRLCLGLSLYR